METNNQIATPTPEGILAILQENALQMKKFNDDFDRRMKESEQERKKNNEDFERRMKESNEDFERRMKEYDRKAQESSEDYERRRKESSEDFERRMKEYKEDYERRMKKMENVFGSWNNNLGSFAEEYFVNSFERGKQNFFGEHFDEVKSRVKGIKKNYDDEYDILLINGKSVGIIEVKFKGHQNDIPKTLKKAETFRINFPDYKDHKVYLGFATMAFYPELEEECKNNGIAIIKQVGDNVVIIDEHLKTY
jgi:hypothetical protein